MKNIWEVQSINKRVYLLEKEFSPIIKRVAYNVKSKFRDIPLEVEDFYNLILYKAAKKVAFFNENLNDNFKAFFIITIRNEAMNQARMYLSRKHKIMNFYIPIHDIDFKLSDSSKVKIPLLEFLTVNEMNILEDFYIRNIPKKELYKKHSINLSILNKLVKKVHVGHNSF